MALDRDGVTLAVGAASDRHVGAVYLFRRSGEEWRWVNKLAAPDGELNDHLGWDVSFSGGFVAAGNWSDDDLGTDSGSAYVFGPCALDFECDGFVDFADYLAFLNLYDALDPAADLTGDGVVDLADFLLFLDRYGAAC